MNSMIKFFSIISLLYLSSCASIDYGYFADFRGLFKRNAIEISDSYIQNSKYSFIKVSYSGNDAVFVLSDISSANVHRWVGSNYEVIKTKHGLIVETQGLEFDIKFHSIDFNFNELSNYSSYINLYNPDLFYEKVLFTALEDIDRAQDRTKDSESNIRTVQLLRQLPSIAWKSKDTFFLRDGKVIKSIQKINPQGKYLTIDFYYKP